MNYLLFERRSIIEKKVKFMKFAENSRFCFCVEFDLKNYKKFNEIIRKEFQKIHNDTNKTPKDITRPLNLRNKQLITPVLYSFNMESFSLDNIKPSDETLNEIIKEDIEKQKEFFKIPKAHLRIEFKTRKSIFEEKFFEIFEKYPEKTIVEKIEKQTNDNFNITTCVDANFDKNAKVLQGIKLRRSFKFPGGINEKIGVPYIKLIGLDIMDSPLGVEEVEFGEELNKKVFNMRMEFKTKNISDIKDIFKTINDMIKLFVMEEE